MLRRILIFQSAFLCLALARGEEYSIAPMQNAAPAENAASIDAALNAPAEPYVPPAPTPAPEESPEPTEPPKPPYCANTEKLQKVCGSEGYAPESLFGSPTLNPWKVNYAKEDRCKLWWWAEHAKTWNYGPLNEWAKLLQEALLENINTRIVFDTVGLAPVPPHPKFDDRNRPIGTCKVPTGQEWLFLSDRLKRLNLTSISPELLLELTRHCLAFEVEASLWKKISSKTVASYILPVGDIYFVILAETHVNLAGKPLFKDRPDNYVVASRDFGITFTTVGSCPVKKDPRNCVEDFIRDFKDEKSTYGFPKGLTYKIDALPFRAELDALYSGGGIDEPFDVEMVLEKDGSLHFFLIQPGGQRSRIRMGLDEEGNLAFETDEKLCDPDNSEGKALVLRPLSIGDRVQKVFRELASYGSYDFPESKRLGPAGIEKGCRGKTYSQWAAETANAAKHYAFHGMPWDTLYRSTAYQRNKWSLKSLGIPQLRDNLTFGQWRKDAQETPLEYGSAYEKRAVEFAKQGMAPGQEPNITYRTILIDDVPATEVWFYAKPVSFWPGKSKQGHIIINHLKNYDEIYSRSVIAKLVQLSTTCMDLTEHKKGFLAAMYALFNASPLQKGSEAVGKVFMAASYHYLYGYKIRAMKKLVDVDFDAQTMGLDEFIKKYLPLIN